MEVEVNGDERTVGVDRPTVEELLAQLGVEVTSGLAVAVDGEVVARSRWEECSVDDGARVEIIRASQGG